MEATYRASIWKLPIDNSSKLFILQRALTDIMYKANINYSILKERLDVLVKQGLLEERTVGKRRVVYAITERGRSLCALKQLKKILWNIRPLLKLSCYWAREIKMARDPKRLG